MIKRKESNLLSESKVAMAPSIIFFQASPIAFAYQIIVARVFGSYIRQQRDTRGISLARSLARRSIRPSHPIFLADSPLATAQCATGTAAGVRHSERGRERSGGLHRFRQWLRWGGCRCGQTDGRVGPVTDPLHLTFLGVGKGRNKNNWGRGEREKGRQREGETRQR